MITIHQSDIDYLVNEFKIKRQKNNNEIKELTVRQAKKLLELEEKSVPEIKPYDEQFIVIGVELFIRCPDQVLKRKPLRHFKNRKTILKLVNMID